MKEILPKKVWLEFPGENRKIMKETILEVSICRISVTHIKKNYKKGNREKSKPSFSYR